VFNFGVNTTNKFTTAHYEIFYVKKNKNSIPVFNTNCRYGNQEKEDGKSLRYQDMQSVWCINKEYQPGITKNKNKLPEELIKKMILYSSNENDIVCDFFLGNFTTAFVSKKLNRIPCGFEKNKIGFKENVLKLKDTQIGSDIVFVENENLEHQGEKITKDIVKKICNDFENILKEDSQKTNKKIIKELSIKYGRGIFSIEKILKEYSKDILSSKHRKSLLLGYDIFETDN
jgi:site-specific DNA-methyltransferase (adenine-specific)